MSWITTSWSMAAAAALTAAVLFGLVWTLDRRNFAYLTLCAVAISVAALARGELGLMHAATVADYRDWLRLCHVPLFFAFIGQLLFVQLYLGTGRRWLLWTIIYLRLLVLLSKFPGDRSIDWHEVADLNRVPFLGELIAVPGPVDLRFWHWLAVASCVLAIVFVTDAALRAWRRGDAEQRRKALVAAGGVGLPLAISSAYWQWALLHPSPLPLLITPTFAITIVVVAVEMSRGFLLSRQQRQELEDLRSELARAGRVTALGQLASALAHELSQPIGAILRNAEAAELHLNRPSPDLEELRAIVTDIRKDDLRAGHVIDQMRALIKRRTLEMCPLALKEVVQDVILLLQTDAAARQVALDCVVAPGLPLVSGDRVHLSQVLLNLVINGMDAIQASEGSTKRVVIEARTRQQGRIEVAVTDSGTGIPAESMDKVFDPFYTTKSSGLGMGLPISRTIIEAHGGRLWAENALSGHGVTFRFTLCEAHGALS
jgi:signal transduction histidine kinase